MPHGLMKKLLDAPYLSKNIRWEHFNAIAQSHDLVFVMIET